MLPLIFAAALAASSADTAAVRALENQWSAAYVTGDAAFLTGLLTEDYVSIGGDGAAHPKAMIVQAAMKYAAEHPGAKPTPMPASSTIAVTGDLALVRHTSDQGVSVDVFQKRSGAWRAVYSQHTRVVTAPVTP